MSVVRLRGGLVPVSRDEADSLAATMRGLEVEVIDLDLRDARTKREVLDRLAGALAFPESFGRNWDALVDALRDVVASETSGTLVVVEGLGDYRAEDPAGATTLLEILDEASADQAVHGRVLGFALVE